MPLSSLAKLLALAAIWGASFLFIRIGAPVFGPGLLIELRLGLAALFLWVVCRWLGHRLDVRRDWKYFLVIGLLNAALPFLLYAYAARTLGASMLAILNSATPTFTAIVAAIWLRQRISRPNAIGLACGMLGVACVAWNGLATQGEGWWLALTAGLGAPFCYALAGGYARSLKTVPGPEDAAHGSMWAAALLAVPAAALMPAPASPTAGDWAAVSVLGFVCTGYAFLLFFRLIGEIGPTGAVSVTFLIPIFGVLWGVLFLDETVGWNTLAGGLLVLLGTALTNGVSLLKWRRWGIGK